jgi:hypothetical protein
MEWLHLYNSDSTTVAAPRRWPTGAPVAAPPLPGHRVPGHRGRPRRGRPRRPAHRGGGAPSRGRPGATLDPAASGRLGGRGVRPRRLPRDDPPRPAPPGSVVEGGAEAARPGRSAAAAELRRARPRPAGRDLLAGAQRDRHLPVYLDEAHVHQDTSTRMPASAMAGRSAAGASGPPRARRAWPTGSPSTASTSTTRARCGSGPTPVPTVRAPSTPCIGCGPSGRTSSWSWSGTAHRTTVPRRCARPPPRCGSNSYRCRATARTPCRSRPFGGGCGRTSPTTTAILPPRISAAEDLGRRGSRPPRRRVRGAPQSRLNQDPCTVADRLRAKDQLDPEEEKLRFSN